VKSGTGFFVSPGNYLLTSRHVVAGCRGISVWPRDGVEHGARIVAEDEQLDIALLSVGGHDDGSEVSHYRDGLELGDAVLTIGYGIYPTQPRKSVLTQGTFVRRDVSPDGARIMIVLATLRPGNSGGPVIDRSGALVGMVIGRYAEHSNLAVIIPGRAIDRFLSLTGLSHLSGEMASARNGDPDKLIARISALVQCTGEDG
jgi:S1-C subfamily serine protease